MADLKDEHLEASSSRKPPRRALCGERRRASLADRLPTGPEGTLETLDDAVAYARRAQHLEEYRQAARRWGTSALQAATFDFFTPPEICDIDLEDYHGEPGDSIRVVAKDDLKVTRVGVLITDGGNRLVEMGQARPAGTGHWVYTAARRVRGGSVRVIVDAADLPGHLTEGRAEKSV